LDCGFPRVSFDNGSIELVKNPKFPVNDPRESREILEAVFEESIEQLHEGVSIYYYQQKMGTHIPVLKLGSGQSESVSKCVLKHEFII
jgi:hypothetical protein